MEGAFFLSNWFLEAMKWVYSNIALENTVLTIVVCTVLLRCVTIFSDIKTRKSSAKMALIQPELERLQKKYKDNPQKLQIEHKKLMKEGGVSMWSSCLPLLITFPLFICFFEAFRYWANEQMIELLLTANRDAAEATKLFASYKFLWVNNIWQADNGFKPVVMDAVSFLSTKNLSHLLFFKHNPDALLTFEQLGLAIQSKMVVGGEVKTVWTFLTSDSAIATYNTLTAPFKEMYAGHNNGWFIWPLIAGGLMFLASKLQQPKKPKDKSASAGNASSQQEQTNKLMMYMFPIVSFIACLSSNAAFAIYWSISNVCMIVINLILNKKYPRVAPDAAGASGEKK